MCAAASEFVSIADATKISFLSDMSKAQNFFNKEAFKYRPTDESNSKPPKKKDFVSLTEEGNVVHFDAAKYPISSTIPRIIAIVREKLPSYLSQSFIDELQKKFSSFFDDFRDEPFQFSEIQKVKKFITEKLNELIKHFSKAKISLDEPFSTSKSLQDIFASLPTPDLSFKFKYISATDLIYINSKGDVEFFDPKKAEGFEDTNRERIKFFVEHKLSRLRTSQKIRDNIFREFCKLDIFITSDPVTYGQIQEINAFLDGKIQSKIKDFPLHTYPFFEFIQPDDDAHVYVNSLGFIEFFDSKKGDDDTTSRDNIKKIIKEKLAFFRPEELSPEEQAQILLTLYKSDVFYRNEQSAAVPGAVSTITYGQIERLNEAFEYLIKAMRIRSILFRERA